jgi:hypothetical protein
MQKFRHDPNLFGIGYPIIGDNSEALAFGDAVYIDANGHLDKVTTSSKVLGYSLHEGTLTSDNETVAKVCPQYIPALGVDMVYGADQDCTQTDIGAYADFGTVTTNAFELNLAAGATGQMLVLGFDPDGEADNDAVVVTVAEPQILAFAQS